MYHLFNISYVCLRVKVRVALIVLWIELVIFTLYAVCVSTVLLSKWCSSYALSFPGQWTYVMRSP